MSAESLGHSGKILSTSPIGSDIDETEISSPKGPFVPLFNKQNMAVNKPLQHKQKKPLHSQILKLDASPEEQENNGQVIGGLVTPRGLSKSTSANLVLSH